MVSVIVHAKDASINGKERPVQAPGDGPVEIFPFVFGHLKNDLGGIFDSTGLESHGEDNVSFPPLTQKLKLILFLSSFSGKSPQNQ